MHVKRIFVFTHHLLLKLIQKSAKIYHIIFVSSLISLIYCNYLWKPCMLKIITNNKMLCIGHVIKKGGAAKKQKPQDKIYKFKLDSYYDFITCKLELHNNVKPFK